LANPDSRKLQVDVIARITSLEKAMAKAAKVTDTNMKKVETRAAAMVSKVNSHFSNFGKGLLAGVAAGGVAGIINQVGAVAKGIASIGDEAKRAGLSSSAFQELGYVAKQNRIEVDALTDGMKELSLRADEYIATGKGSAAESFQRLGISAAELKEKLKDPSALFSEIIGKLQQLDKAAQIRIADELFGGTGGEKFVQLIAQGEAGIKATIEEARRLGAVMSDDVIEAAAELDRQFNAITTTVSTGLKTAIVEAASALRRFIDEFNSFEDRATTSLKTRFSELQTRRGQLTFGPEGQPGLVQSGLALIGKDAASELKAIDEEMAQIAAELKQRAIPRLRQELLQQTAASAPYVAPPATGGSKAKDGFKPDRGAFAEMLGVTEDYLEAQRLANQQLEAFGDLAVDAGTSLVNAMQDGVISGQELLGIITNIAQQLLRMPGLTGLLGGILGGGGFSPTAGGFASMLGIPGRASGGPVQAGMPYIVGERRPELFVPDVPGRIVPRVPSVAGLHGGGGGGASVVELRLSPELTAQILAEAKGQSIRIAQSTTASGIKAYDAGKARQQLTRG